MSPSKTLCLCCRLPAPFSPHPSSSEIELQPQLHDARIVRCQHLAKCTAEQVGIDRFKIRVIQHIERLEAELEAHRFCQLDVFEQREVPAFDAGSTDAAAR